MIGIVGIIGTGGDGGTLLDWTLHYLAGDTFYTGVAVDRIKESIIGVFESKLLHNPLTTYGNAHSHRKTHPTDITLPGTIELLKAQGSTRKKLYHKIYESSLHSMYIVPTTDTFTRFESHTDFTKHTVATFTDLKYIHVHYPDEFMEDIVDRIHTKIFRNKEPIEYIRSFVQRECNNKDKIIVSPIVYPLNIKDIYYNLDTEIYKIFTWLNLSIDKKRYNNWITVYKEWQVAQNFKGM
jgi:hypothetical protein